MLKVFLDDSGTDPAVGIAGYLGGKNQWNKFERSWKKVIERNNVPEFKARNFWSRTGHFLGWSDERRGKFIDDLLRIIEETRIYPFAAATYRKDWDQFSIEERRFLTGAVYRNGKLIVTGKPSQPKFLPFHHCIIGPLFYCNPGQVTYYHFDSDKNSDGLMTKLYFYMRNKALPGYEREKMGSQMAFVDSVDCAPVQAADLLAWEVNRYATERLENPGARGRQSYRRAIKKLRSKEDFELYDKRKLDPILEFVRKNGALPMH
ncbi:MAG: DUF3800 domain-containing protein [Candidatus Acidiferrales bacterium]